MQTIYDLLYPADAEFAASSFPQYVKANGTSFPVSGLAYDAASQENAYWKFTPLLYGGVSTLVLYLIWYADTASSGVVRWDAAIAAITPDVDTQDVEAKALATSTSLDDTHLGTTGQRLHLAVLTLTNLDSMAAKDACFIRISRLGNHANDTLAGDVILERAYLAYQDA
jgi:hypothetical protein